MVSGTWSTSNGRGWPQRLLIVAACFALACALWPATACAVAEMGHSSIRGVVTSDGVTPVYRAGVVAWRSDGAGGWTPSYGAYVMKDGTYQIEGLLAGTYRLVFDPFYTDAHLPTKWHAEKRSVWHADDVVVGPASVLEGMDANLAAGHIAGRAIDGDGQGVGGVTVSAYEPGDWSGWTKVSVAVTDPQGYYDVGALRTGTHRLMFETSADHLGVAFGGGDSVWSDLAVDIPVLAGTTNSDNNIILLPAGHIAGTVTNDGSTGISGITARLYRRDGEALYDRGTRTTAADGTYDFGGLESGTYHLVFSDPRLTYPGEYYEDQPEFNAASEISVISGSTTQADAELTAGRIRGRVTAYGAGGVERIEARIYRMQDEAVIDASAFDFYTDSDGFYDIGGLTPLADGETYHVAFLDVHGYSDGGLYDAEYYLNKETLAQATTITVPFGSTVSNINATLEAGNLTGTVTDGSAGIEGVHVYAYEGTHGLQLAAYTRTGPNGAYSFTGLAVGSYRLYFWDDSGRYRNTYSGYATDLESASQISVSYAGTSVHHVALQERGHIAGRVTSDGINGIAGVSVRAWCLTEAGWQVLMGETAADGTYDVAGLEPGSYRVSFDPPYNGDFGSAWYGGAPNRDSAAPVPVNLGETIGGIDATLTELGRVAGAVTDGSSPVSNIQVRVYRSGGAGDGEHVGGAITADDGSYTVKGLPAGTYRIEFADDDQWYYYNAGTFLDEWYPDAPDQALAGDVSVTNAATTTIDASLAREASLHGAVKAEDGSGIGEVWVGLRRKIGTSWVSSPTIWDKTASDGSYDFGRLRAGTYRIDFSDSNRTYLSEYYDDSIDWAGASELSLLEGEAKRGLDATLAAGGRITGTVKAEDGTPLPNVIVYVDARTPTGAWAGIGSYGTQADGSYNITPLRTGTYRLQFHDPAGTYGLEFYDDAAGPSVCTGVDVVAGETTETATVYLGRAGSIEGTITAQGGTAISDAWACAYVSNGDGGWDLLTMNYSGPDGRYQITGLREGQYRVKFIPAAPYLSEWWDDESGPDSAQDVTVVAGERTEGVSAVLHQPSHLTGRVTSDGTTGIAGILVRAEAPDGAGGWTLAKYGYTDSEGRYDLSDLLPGLYRVAFDGNAEYVGEWYDDAHDEQSAQTVTVLRGVDTTGIDAVLATRGHIAGRVTSDGVTGISGVYVCAKAPGVFWGSWEVKGYAYTDDEGNYDIPGLLPGAYRIGYFDWNGEYAEEWYDDKPTVDSAIDVSATPGATTGGIDAVLAAPASIEGTVTDSYRAGLAGVTVRAYLRDGDGGWNLFADTWTGTTGAYDLAPLPAGSYRVEFVAGGDYLTEWYSDARTLEAADDVGATAGAATTGVDAVLARAGSISGSVTSSASEAIADMYVYAYLQDGSGAWDYAGWGRTDQAGSYQVAGLRPGSYRVWFAGDAAHAFEYYDDSRGFDSATTVIVNEGADTGRIDAVLAQTGSISGKVTSDGTTVIPSVHVAVFERNGEGGWDNVGNALTDDAGAYSVSGLFEGTYRLRFYPEEPYLGECWNDAASLDVADDIVVLAGEDTGGTNAVLSAGGHLTGTVTSDGSTGLGEMDVYLYADDAQGYWDYEAFTTTKSDGSYDFGGLRTGTYRVRFSGDSNHFGEYYSDKTDLASADPVAVTEGSTSSNVDAVLSPAAHITGRVTSNGTDGIENVWVTAYESSGSGGWEYAGSASTAADGSYDIGGLAGGSYRLGFSDSSGEHVSEFYQDASELDDAAPVLVAAGGTATGVDAVLDRAGSVSGTVRVGDSAPVSDVSVSAWSREEGAAWARVSTVWTEDDGTYSIGGLRAGTYRIGFEHADFIEEFWDDSFEVDSADDVYVSAGADSGSIDATLSAGARISGKVTSDGSSGIEGIDIYAFRSGRYAGYASTAADGTYDVKGLLPGSYEVQFQAGSTGFAGEWYDDTRWRSSASLISLATEQARDDVDAVLTRNGYIAGAVTTDGTQGIADVEVTVYGPDGAGGWEPVDYCSTDASGSYRTNGLAEGSYKVRFVDTDGVHAPQYYGADSDLESALDVVVIAGETTGDVDVLMAAAGHIIGRVTSDGVLGIADIWVWAMAPDGRGGWDWSAGALTGADGGYDMSGLASGTYRVMFYDASGLHATQFSNAKSAFAAADGVEVTAGLATEGVDAVLEAAGRIAGNVTSDAVGVPNVYVTAYTPDGLGGWMQIGFAETDANGTYEVGGLATGAYRLGYEDSNGVHPIVYYDMALGLGSAQDVDVIAGSATSGVDIEYSLAPENTAPVSMDDTATVAEDAVLTVAASGGVLANDSDIDGDALSVILVDPTRNGTLALSSNGSYTYRPAANWHGTDLFTYRASDGHAQSAIATVTITVTPENDAPVAVTDAYTTDEDVARAVDAADGVLINDNDVDEDPLSVVAWSSPSVGTLSATSTAGAFTYTPPANFNGSATFTYTVSDGMGGIDTATVTITVNAVNDAPVAVADAYATAHNTALVITAPGVLGNDTDVDGDMLAAVKMANPAHGSLTLNANGSFTYTPAAGYSGPDSFTYKANDGKDDSAPVMVSITVGAAPAPPVRPSPVATTLSLSSSNSKPKYDAAVTLSATLLGNGAGLSGQPVVFERQSGTGWVWVGSAFTGWNGVVSVSVKPYGKAKTTYRARFDATSAHLASDSSVIVNPQVYLTKGNAPSTMYKGKAKTVTGYLKPHHTSGSTSTVRIYRYKRNSSGVYKKVDYVKAKLGNYSSYSKYTKSFSFPSKGKWSIRAYHPADSKHAATWSSYHYVTVK